MHAHQEMQLKTLLLFLFMHMNCKTHELSATYGTGSNVFTVCALDQFIITALVQRAVERWPQTLSVITVYKGIDI